MARRAILAKLSASTPTGEAADAHDALAGLVAACAVSRMMAFALDIAREIRGIGVGLEADQIVFAQGGNDALVMRQAGDDLHRRKRRVQEKADAVLVTEFAQGLGEQQEMIIMHPDDVVGLQDLVQLRRRNAR